MKGKLNPNFKFRSGKYAGWTLAEVFDIAPGYLNWVYENKPQMLKGAGDLEELVKIVILHTRE